MRNKKDDDFNEASYVGVNERLKKFREDHPEGSIDTSRTGEEGGIIFKCVVFRNHKEVELYATAGIAAASGHAYLPDWAREEEKVEEYAETVSIGRALACLGYSADKFASSEEMDQYNRLHGNEEEEPEEDEVEEEEEEKPRTRRSRKAASKSKKDDEEEPKLRSSRRINRSSKLSSRKKNKGD